MDTKTNKRVTESDVRTYMLSRLPIFEALTTLDLSNPSVRNDIKTLDYIKSLGMCWSTKQMEEEWERVQFIVGNAFNKVLEIGCATGNLTKYLQKNKNVDSILAIDILPEYLSVLKKLNLNNVEILCKNLIDKPLDNKLKFDCVIMTEFIEHITTNEEVKILKNIMNNLANKTKFIITTPIDFMEDPSHKRGFSRMEGFVHLLFFYGMVTKISKTNVQQFYVVKNQNRIIFWELYNLLSRNALVFGITKKFYNWLIVLMLVFYRLFKLIKTFFAKISPVINHNDQFTNLTSNQWFDVMVKNKSLNDLALKIKNRRFSLWVEPLLKHTSEGNSTLELGSGTGELSASLNVNGRITHLLDYSSESIAFSQSLFNKLMINGSFYCGDVLKGIPVENSAVDWVWSSGLLEHFSDEQILNILKESVRVCRKGVMSLVPNANSIFYRIGKLKMESERTWKYGIEIPKFTLKDIYVKVGLKNVEEYSIAVEDALAFWGRNNKEIKVFFDSIDHVEKQRLNQGYLLFTYGEK